MQGRGGADPDGMSVSLFQGRLLRGLPRGGSGLDRGLRVWAVIFFWGGGKKGRAVGAGRGVARVLTRGQEEATSGREALAGRPPPPRRRD